MKDALKAERRLTFVPVIFILLRIWGTLRFILFTYTSTPTNNKALDVMLYLQVSYHLKSFSIRVERVVSCQTTIRLDGIILELSPTQTKKAWHIYMAYCQENIYILQLILQFPTANCKFSFLVASHYLQQRRREFFNISTEFMLGNYILYSHDLSD